MSALACFPRGGEEGLRRRFVLEQVGEQDLIPAHGRRRRKGWGNFEKGDLSAPKAALASRRGGTFTIALLGLERELWKRSTTWGSVPRGSGRITALRLSISNEVYPCHITGIWVAVNMNCHAARHQTEVL